MTVVVSLVLAVPLSAGFGVLAWSMFVGAAFSGGATWFAFAIVYSIAAPVKAFLAFVGAELIGTQIAKSGMYGRDGYYPSCCCAAPELILPQNVSYADTCLLLGTTKPNRRGAPATTCPANFTHVPAGCQSIAPELTYHKTVRGCLCEDSTECSTNKPRKGHAWCKTQRDSCIRRARRWDYCRITKATLKTEDATFIANANLAHFVPNLVRHFFRVDARNPFRWGSYVDQAKGIVTARPGARKRSQCFAGLPAEYMEKCAERCLIEGAPNVKWLDNERNEAGSNEVARHKCVAFAYHHTRRLCVTLPKFARGAEFRPYARRMRETGELKGWSNFKLDPDFVAEADENEADGPEDAFEESDRDADATVEEEPLAHTAGSVGDLD